jgi:adenine/guanine phosphoribosyltransferase-like PRPP-binding protein
MVEAKRPHEHSNRLEVALEEASLREKFISDVRVVDPDKGYISLPWVNELIDTRLQHMAARVIVYKLQHQLDGRQQITKVAGIPTLGVNLANPVSEELGVPLAPTRKGKHVPSRWEEAVVLERDMKPYTNGVPATHIYNGLQAEDVVLFTDDVLGDGTTLIPIIKNIKECGIIPLVGVYAAKLYRPGFEALRSMGVEPVYVYGIEEVTKSGEVVLAPPQVTV